MGEFSPKSTVENLSDYEREKIDATIEEAQRLIQQLVTAKSMLESAGAEGSTVNLGDIAIATPLLGNGQIRESLQSGTNIGNRVHEAVDKAVGREGYNSYIPVAQDALKAYYQAKLDELQ